MSELQSLLLIGAASTVVIFAAITLYRVAVGPSVQDRVVGINVIGTSTVIVIALVSAGLDRPELLDIAIVYALLNFVVSLAVAQFTISPSEVPE